MLTMTEGSKEMERRDFHLMMIIVAFSALPITDSLSLDVESLQSTLQHDNLAFRIPWSRN